MKALNSILKTYTVNGYNDGESFGANFTNSTLLTDQEFSSGGSTGNTYATKTYTINANDGYKAYLVIACTLGVYNVTYDGVSTLTVPGGIVLSNSKEITNKGSWKMKIGITTNFSNGDIISATMRSLKCSFQVYGLK